MITIQNFSASDLTLGGNFNTVFDNNLDKNGGAPQHSNLKASAVVKTYANT